MRVALDVAKSTNLPTHGLASTKAGNVLLAGVYVTVVASNGGCLVGGKLGRMLSSNGMLPMFHKGGATAFPVRLFVCLTIKQLC